MVTLFSSVVEIQIGDGQLASNLDIALDFMVEHRR